MNDAASSTSKLPTCSTLAAVWVLVGMLVYLGVVLIAYFFFFARGDWRNGVAIFGGLNVISYLLTLVALFRPFSR